MSNMHPSVEVYTCTEESLPETGTLDESQMVVSCQGYFVHLLSTAANLGFSLGLLLEACIQYQSSTSHPDPINITAHYLQVVQTAEFEVRVRALKVGRGFSNLLAELVQKVSPVCAVALVSTGSRTTPRISGSGENYRTSDFRCTSAVFL